jgi:lysozyme
MTDVNNKISNFKKLLAAVGLSGALAGSYLIYPFEGQVNHVYADPINLLTVCVGHVNNTLRMGQTFTDEQCLETLVKDITKHDKQLMGVVKVPMNDFQHAAFLSFVFNVGIVKFSNSTMLGKLNAGNYKASCDELIKWRYAGGKVLKGLERRREMETQMCYGTIKLDKEVLDAIAQSK